MAALALAVFLVQRAQLGELVGLTVAVAMLALLVAFAWRRPAAVAWATVLLGLAYGLTLVGRGEGIDAGSLVVAGWLFLTAELAYLAVEPDSLPHLPWRPVAAAALVALGSIVLGVVLLAISQSLAAAGPLLTAAGVTAALALIALIARSVLVRSHIQAHEPPFRGSVR